jgi:hypothetical protein
MKNLKLFTILFMGLSVFSISYANESAFDSVMDEPLTVEQEAMADNYIHQGMADKKASEMCEKGKGGYDDICDEDKYGFKDGSMRKLEALVPALTKAYSMFSMMGGGAGGFTAKSLDKDGKQIYQDSDGKTKGVTKETEGSSEKTEEKKDYCGYIAMIGEGASTAYTMVKNDKTEQNFKSEKPEARQVASFYALAENHETMEKGAKVQMGVWSATAGCYVVYATQASYQGDWKVYAKMAAAGFIGLYYKKKADAHGERADLLKKMAKDLPGAGDCNPFTNKSCFCAEETSPTSDPINYRNICLPQALADRTKDGEDEAFICADANGKPDLDCDCVKTNTCADRRLKVAGINLGLGPTVMKDPLAAMKPISKGFGGADVDAAANRNLALANKTLKKFKPSKAPKLNDKQKKIANELFKNGIPKAAAAYLAKGFKGSDGAKLPSGAVAGISGGPSKYRNTKSGSKNKKASFKSGGTIRGKSTRGKKGFGRFGKKRGNKNTKAIHIEDFAEKAARKAEIVTDTSRGIFDIISYRYKVSAWREFKDVMKTSPEPQPAKKNKQ